MKNKPIVTIASSLPLLLAAAFSHAQVVDVSGCREIEDSLERFACYESLGEEQQSSSAEPSSADQARQEAPAASPPGADRSRSRGSAENRRESPAVADVEAFGRPQARVEQDDQGKAELRDTIVKLERFTPNQWDVTLSSGQVWRQVVGKQLYLKEGEDVRIYPTSWGDNYRLSPESKNGYIEVQRLR